MIIRQNENFLHPFCKLCPTYEGLQLKKTLSQSVNSTEFITKCLINLSSLPYNGCVKISIKKAILDLYIPVSHNLMSYWLLRIIESSFKVTSINGAN